MRAVGKGHDNELFVLLADLVELDEQLESLLRSVKVAIARHHQVVVVCPWPAGVALPENGRAKKGQVAEEPTLELLKPDTPLPEAVRRATTIRFHRAYYRLRRTFGRLGVPVVCAASGDPAKLILDRLERLRSVGRGR